MPSFPPGCGWHLPGPSDEPSNDWDTPYNQPAGTPDLVRSMGLDTQPALSQIEMLNYLLRFYQSHAPAAFVGPAHNPPVQAPGLNAADLDPLPQDDYSNGMTGDFIEPSMLSQIVDMHGFNQALPNIDPCMQDQVPIQAQEQGPAPRTPQSAPSRGRRNAHSRPRPYERRHDNEQSTGVFRCEWKNCGQTFSRKEDRNRHVNTKHLSPGSNECPHCDRTFNRRDNLRQHLSNVHRGGNNRSSARGVLE